MIWAREAPGSLLLSPGWSRGYKRGEGRREGGLGGERSTGWAQWCLGDLHLEPAISFLMGILETELREKWENCSWSAGSGESAVNAWAVSDPRSWKLCGDSSLEQGHPVRMSHRDSVVGPGQEKSSNSSHLCQKLRCLSSQSQEASAPGVCAGGLLVLPRLWVSQGWHKDSCRSWSGAGAAALWSHFKGCPAAAPWPLPCPRHREPWPELLALPVTKDGTGVGSEGFIARVDISSEAPRL
ncbi:uncharacterized protein LOC121333610 isoform X2 [Onychostruthus taczanowskii]|uniref:uncharacterized protein LOC121333610 isoform X2 n=1 Tax=Onychostruthus taczanowskii TaxID=356909 RepID=UPI001B8003DF|nr:uncharacterized protein LOC121333610 isoform X2 [Onychostruthus taczanowskii]